MLEKLERERQSLTARETQLVRKEETLAKEETRIKEESQVVATMMSNREYSTEERERIVLDYSDKMTELEERLRQNEKAIRENNREFVPLRRIKNTFDRDMRLLRKREAIIAKQEVIVYGVNNITTVDPARIKKLEQEVKQLSALQQSIANCETILNKNKDRYPTLENLDKVLHSQNDQIKADIEEVKAAMTIFGETENK
jgi:chromosome segregation ATPase